MSGSRFQLHSRRRTPPRCPLIKATTEGFAADNGSRQSQAPAQHHRGDPTG